MTREIKSSLFIFKAKPAKRGSANVSFKELPKVLEQNKDDMNKKL